VVELGGLDEAGVDRPVVAAIVRAGEQRIPAIEGSIVRSTVLLSSSTRPSSRNSVRLVPDASVQREVA
jgi:hypothetical protein